MTRLNEQAECLQWAAKQHLDLVHLTGQEELTLMQARAVLSWWHTSTGGLEFASGTPGKVGVQAYHWLIAKHGLAARNIDTAQRIDNPWVDAMSRDLALHIDWLTPDAFELVDLAEPRVNWKIPPGQVMHLTEWDINGQFHASAGIELGTGEPDRIEEPRTLDAYLRMPGYIRLAADPWGLVDHLPHTWRAFVRYTAGATMSMPTVRYLVKHGVELDAAEVVFWIRHRRHLSTWYSLFRDARFKLANAAAAGNLGAVIALGLLKMVCNLTLGGWLRSNKNPSDMMRRDWSDQIITEAWVRALVAIDKAGQAGTPAVGMRRDAAWFLGPRNFQPAGLDVDTIWHESGVNGKLGKWKRTRSVPVTPQLRDAWKRTPEIVNKAIKASWESANV